MRVEIMEDLDLPSHRFSGGTVVEIHDKELIDTVLASGKARPAIERAVKPAPPETHDATRPRRRTKDT